MPDFDISDFQWRGFCFVCEQDKLIILLAQGCGDAENPLTAEDMTPVCAGCLHKHTQGER